MGAKRIYKITLEGQYMSIGDASGSKVIKKYSAEFKLLSMEAALSVIVSKLLDSKLRQTYEGYVTYRTHRIVKVEVEGPKPNADVLSQAIEGMSMAQLTDFCILRELPVDPAKSEGKKVKTDEGTVTVSPLEVARDRVIKAWDNKRATIRDEAIAKTETDKDDELLALNNIEREDAPVKMIFSDAKSILTDAHTPGAKMVERVVDPVAPLDAPLPEVEPDGIE